MRITIIEPAKAGLTYLAIVETDGFIEPMSEVAFTTDRKLYDLDYETGSDPRPRMDVWDLGIVFTGLGPREITVSVKEEGKEVKNDKPVVRDGM
jgi:hypothetical protein